MKKSNYIAPITRIRPLGMEFSILSPIPGTGEPANPVEEDWE